MNLIFIVLLIIGMFGIFAVASVLVNDQEEYGFHDTYIIPPEDVISDIDEFEMPKEKDNGK